MRANNNTQLKEVYHVTCPLESDTRPVCIFF